MKNIIKLLAVVVSVGFVGCAHSSKAPPLRMYVFKCGEITINDVSLFSPGVDAGAKKTVDVSCYLIQHPKGMMVWDTGLPDGLVAKPEGIDVFDGKMHLKVLKPFALQLKEIGVTPDKVDYVAFSHMHSDHAGNGNLFNNATVLMQKEEYAAAFGKNSSKFGFDKKNYEKLAYSKVVQLEGNYDVFGDGSVMILRAPGHTPGHQALYVKLEKSGPVVLSGDLYHFKSNRENRRVPAFNFNKDQTLASMDAIEKFVADKNTRFWIQHDPDQNAEIVHAPQFHE